jgi:hypothetical protein
MIPRLLTVMARRRSRRSNSESPAQALDYFAALAMTPGADQDAPFGQQELGQEREDVRRCSQIRCPVGCATRNRGRSRAQPQCARPHCGRLATPRGCADLCNNGAADGCDRWRRAGWALFGPSCVSAHRNGPDVFVDECFSCDALAEADRPPTRCPPFVIRRSSHEATPDRTSRRVAFWLPCFPCADHGSLRWASCRRHHR